jgi:ABC-2 type transport system ATP-binding protein
MSACALRMQGLARRFGALTAVAGLDLEVRAGELFGIVGPDGAGKTTTLRMLAGVLRPSAGDAEILGTSVRRDPEGVKARIAYMSQRFGLYTDLTVRENLDFYADLYGVPAAERPARLARLFAFSGLAPFAQRLAGQLSGGMKQKLGLSCALVHEPELLLLDEPTFGVDPVSRRDLWLIIHEMVGRGVTVVVSTAYLDEAERCDRVALLHQGRLLALDTPAGLKAGYAGELLALRGLTGEGLREARALLAREPGIAAVALFGDALHLTVRSAAAARAGIAARLAAAGLGEAELAPLAASLEDVFIALVGKAAA